MTKLFWKVNGILRCGGWQQLELGQLHVKRGTDGQMIAHYCSNTPEHKTMVMAYVVKAH